MEMRTIFVSLQLVNCKTNRMKVAVVGATGLVGSKMLKVLEERHFPVTELLPVASSRSVGKKVMFQGREWTVMSAEEAIAKKPAVAIFSAGGAASGELAPLFAAAGCRVVDNSSYWRMDPTKKLVVPEINGDVLGPDDYIIANPNCSTIQMVMALAPLHKAYGIKRIVVSTYQSVSGSGQKGVNQLKTERAGGEGDFYPHPIDLNTLPHIDSFLENGYTKEEMKMVNEPRKILRDDSIMSWPTTVRVPVLYGHSESVFVETREPFGTIEDLLEVMRTQEHVVVSDQPVVTPAVDAAGTDTTFVSRVRSFDDRHFLQWNVADNVRVGAATNAVRILLKHQELN